MATCYKLGKGVIQRFKYYKLIADQNITESQRKLGWCYEEGAGVKKDLDMAVFYSELAVDKDGGLAKFYLGKL